MYTHTHTDDSTAASDFYYQSLSSSTERITSRVTESRDKAFSYRATHYVSTTATRRVEIAFPVLYSAIPFLGN